MNSLVLATLLAVQGAATAAAPPDSLPLHLFQYDGAAPLDAQDSLQRTERGAEVRSVSYASPAGGRVTGLLFVPASKRQARQPAVVLMHGMPGRAAFMRGQGISMAARGAVVVAIDAPWARRSGEVLSFTPRDSAEQVQLILDLQRAVDLLRARNDVDPKRVAYYGVSYGAAMGGLFVAVERRLAGAILVVGDGGLVSHFTGADDGGGQGGMLGKLSEPVRQRWLEAMRPIEPLRFVGHAAPTPILFQSGRQDYLVPPADAEALHRAAREPKRVSWYDAGHGLDAEPAAEAERRLWLLEVIGLPISPH